MTLTESVTKKIITRLIKSQDYRVEVVTLLNATFLQYAIDFFKKVVDAKLRNQNITIDWYKTEFLNDRLPSDEIAINSGLNKKTISNMYNSATKEIIIEASNNHYDELYKVISDLADSESEIDITLTIKFGKVGVELNITESLIVINTLAVKRAQLRGGLWSSAGKRVEKPLMLTLCNLFNVDEKYYKVVSANRGNNEKTSFDREIDFYLFSPLDSKDHKCEAKLMGKENPESADAVIARSSDVFIADKLSDLNKRQLDSLGVQWVELRSQEGYKRFALILSKLGIPYDDNIDDIDIKLEAIFKDIFA
ncbi:MAG: CfrBI family restriction endonuclease [Candidatus Poribacteria bacterium]